MEDRIRIFWRTRTSVWRTEGGQNKAEVEDEPRGATSTKGETMCTHKNGVKGYVFGDREGCTGAPLYGYVFRTIWVGLEIYSPFFVK